MGLDELNAVTDLAKECVSCKSEDAALQQMVEVVLAVYLGETRKAYAPLTTDSVRDLLNRRLES